MKNLVRIHMFPPQFEPNMPQMMSLKKLSESRWRWRAPQFVRQAQRAKKREEDDQSFGKNAYLHVEPAEILADWSSPQSVCGFPSDQAPNPTTEKA